MYHLLIGDNEFELSLVAHQMFPNTTLVTNENFDQVINQPTDLFYTSVADLHQDQILKLALDAKEIHYWPIKETSLRTDTEKFLRKLVKLHQLSIRNFSTNFDHTDSLKLMDTRKTHDPQLWVAGCSNAYGYGLADRSERYIEIISKNTNMEYSDLCLPGSSIDWAADQILRSDIQPNDVVIWGITGIHRISYYVHGQPGIINKKFIEQFDKKDKEFFLRLITDDNRMNQSVKNVFQVHNYLKKVGATLILLVHKQLSLYQHFKEFEEYLWSIQDCVIYGEIVDKTFDQHPGPLTNRLWADEILKVL